MKNIRRGRRPSPLGEWSVGQDNQCQRRRRHLGFETGLKNRKHLLGGFHASDRHPSASKAGDEMLIITYGVFSMPSAASRNHRTVSLGDQAACIYATLPGINLQERRRAWCCQAQKACLSLIPSHTGRLQFFIRPPMESCRENHGSPAWRQKKKKKLDNKSCKNAGLAGNHRRLSSQTGAVSHQVPTPNGSETMSQPKQKHDSLVDLHFQTYAVYFSPPSPLTIQTFITPASPGGSRVCPPYAYQQLSPSIT